MAPEDDPETPETPETPEAPETREEPEPFESTDDSSDRDGESADRATTVRELTTDAAWDAAVPLLCQLWGDADPAFVRSWRDEDGYRLFGLYVGVDATETDGGEMDSESDSGEMDSESDSGEMDSESDGSPGTLVGVAGVSVQRVLHHRRHAWIHDLVVDESRRGAGFGAELLAFVERWAAARDCEYVALANRLDNDAALSFYEDEGLERWGYVLERRL
ncbi:MAG: GNAT family N-acetyltransferase [Haloglomus sp.]